MRCFDVLKLFESVHIVCIWMNEPGSKEDLVETTIFRRVSAHFMQQCSECQQYLAEIDGVCALCRSLGRLCFEARQLGPCLRTWVVDQTRVWVSVLQEEGLKWRKGQEEARRAAEAAAAASKAPSPAVSAAQEPDPGQQEIEQVAQEEAPPLTAPEEKVPAAGLGTSPVRSGRRGR